MASPQVLSDEPDKVAEPVDETQAADIVSRLFDLEMVQLLVRHWYEISQMCILPLRFMEDILSFFQPFANRLNLLGTNMAVEILHTVSKPFVVPPNTVISAFPKLFAG